MADQDTRHDYNAEQANDIAQSRELAEDVSGDDVQHQKFEDGVTIRTVVGALFVGFIMLPGAMYLGLMAGKSLGSAAQWVTVVLFAEIARRSLQPLKKQELYMLVWIAGGLVGTQAHNLSGGPFANLIWNQYLVQCPQIGELAKEIPHFVAPPANDPAILHRTFLSPSWMLPIALILAHEILGRLMWIGGGYAVFRVTSDVERLPFPLAPIGAAGATALAEAGTKEESWRWQMFSIGSVIGLLFGVVYLFIPIVTGAIFGTPIELIPLLFIDFTQNTERILPGAWAAVSGDISGVLIGFVLPFPIVVGSFLGAFLAKIGLSPILYHAGMLPNWTYGTPYVPTMIATQIDFWMSVSVGTGFAVGLIGLYNVVKGVIESRNERERQTIRRTIPEGRGDWNLYISIGAWFIASLAQVTIAHFLIPDFPIWILVFYGLLYTPIISYISGRLVGLTGQPLNIPYLQPATILLSGYKRTDVWFVGIPMHDLGPIAQRFREVELTGTKFTSIIKIELLMMAILLPTSFFFWSFFWKTTPIPSPQFAYTHKMWPNDAVMQSIWWTANKENPQENWLFKALKPAVIGWAGVGTLITYAVFSLFKIPLLFFYGFINGTNAGLDTTLAPFIGGLFGKYYFGKRFGQVKWSQYAPVLAAGFGCGMGLAAMTAVAVALITKSVNFLPF